MSIKLHRDSLRNRGNCRFVDGPEFLDLAVSHAKLESADDVSAGVRGLRDPATGEIVYVEQEKLEEIRVNSLPR